MERFVCKDGRRLRCGYTTGTCAALAAKAAAGYLLRGVWEKEPGIMTPGGVYVQAGIEEMRAGPQGAGKSMDDCTRRAVPGVWFAECAVRKDAGDDSDVTDGLLIFARAEFAKGACGCGAAAGERGPRVFIEGGKGVGRVTKAGLDQPLGAAAINSGPRRMIEKAVQEVLLSCGEARAVQITIFVPAGERAAESTFNPVLGIRGGISILGTSGIVEPMSDEAMIGTIRVQLEVLQAGGRQYAAAVVGKLGAGFLRRYLERQGLAPSAAGRMCEEAVICSNFIGSTIDLAGELGYSGLLFAGHIGKLVKLGNGMMHTHSREGDGRMDTLLSCALDAGAKLSLLKKIRAANTTNEAVELLKETGLLEKAMERLLDRIDEYLQRRAVQGLEMGVILFGQDGEVLAENRKAGRVLKQLENPSNKG